MVMEVSNFLPNPDEVRAIALASRWRDLKAFDGEVYARVANARVPGLQAALEAHMGPCLILGSGYRLNFNGEEPNHAIHVDEGWGKYALVLYLSQAPEGLETGTAFWRYPGEDHPEIHTDHPEEWSRTYLCREEFGKAVIYPSDVYHSRYPFEAYGDCPENGRLIAVAFFNVVNEL